MSAPSVIRRGLIGVAAVALPAIALGSALLASLYGAEPYLGFLAVAYLMVGGLAWACVRGAGFSPRLAMFLTTLPFGVLVLLALPTHYGDQGVGLLISLGQFALALLLAWWAAGRLAGKS